jgi:nitrite reductase/ring-hydroxylating ferredoxin subunit
MLAKRGEYPFPIPSGWFRVAFVEEVSAGEVKAVRYFGEELVLFSSESGAVQLFGAHCPHLGAHLGRGGSVDGEFLRCPFHGWRFGLGGECVDVPYSRRIPARARLARYPTEVKNGIVWAWFHPEGEEPGWEAPELPELSSGDWSRPVHHRWMIRTRNQEIAENTSDSAHFSAVHGFGDAPAPEIEFSEHTCRSVSLSRVPRRSGDIATSRLEVTWHGLGLGVVRSTGAFELLVAGTNTPVDETTVDACFSFSVCQARGLRPDEGTGKAFIGEAIRQMEQDIPIWENKVFAERPILCDGDGPIGSFRDWAKQFYPPTHSAEIGGEEA